MIKHEKNFPYWWDIKDSLAAPENTALPSEVDLAVVGGGFAGMSAALTAAEAGLSVILFDEGQPGRAASTRNGGICSGHLRIPHSVLAKEFGLENADSVYGEAAIAREDLASFITQHDIQCDYRQAGHFTGALSPADFESMKREISALQAIPGIDVSLVEAHELTSEIQTDRFYGGTLRRDMAGYHPGKFFSALLKIVLKAGVQIEANTEVQEIASLGGGVKCLITARGAVRAQKVIVATNAYTGRKPSFGHFLRRRLVPVQSCIMVTERLGTARVKSLMPGLRLYGNTAKLSCYFRPTPDGTRILLGARSFDRLIPSDKSIHYLRRMLAAMFPSLSDVAVDYCWLGNVAFNRTYLPTIFDKDDITYVGGYGGSGTVWARWLGKKAAQTALGQTNAPSIFSQLYDGKPPPQIPFYDGEPWFLPFVNARYAVQDKLNSLKFGSRKTRN